MNPFGMNILLNKISFVNVIYLLLSVNITYIGLYEFVNFRPRGLRSNVKSGFLPRCPAHTIDLGRVVYPHKLAVGFNMRLTVESKVPRSKVF